MRGIFLCAALGAASKLSFSGTTSGTDIDFTSTGATTGTLTIGNADTCTKLDGSSECILDTLAALNTKFSDYLTTSAASTTYLTATAASTTYATATDVSTAVSNAAPAGTVGGSKRS
jgi:hypothetical protein